MLWRPLARGLAEAGRRGAAAGQRRGVGNLPVKPNEHVEKWGTMREHVEEQFKVGPVLPGASGPRVGARVPPRRPRGVPRPPRGPPRPLPRVSGPPRDPAPPPRLGPAPPPPPPLPPRGGRPASANPGSSAGRPSRVNARGADGDAAAAAIGGWLPPSLPPLGCGRGRGVGGQFDQKHLTTLAVWGVAVPVLIYKASIHEYNAADDHAGRPRKKLM